MRKQEELEFGISAGIQSRSALFSLPCVSQSYALNLPHLILGKSALHRSKWQSEWQRRWFSPKGGSPPRTSRSRRMINTTNTGKTSGDACTTSMGSLTARLIAVVDAYLNEEGLWSMQTIGSRSLYTAPLQLHIFHSCKAILCLLIIWQVRISTHNLLKTTSGSIQIPFF